MKKKERERNDLAEGPCSRTELNDFKKVGTCPALCMQQQTLWNINNFTLYNVYVSRDGQNSWTNKNFEFWTIESFLLNEQCYWTNNFIERTILLNKQFYSTIIHWENEWNRWKMKNIFEIKRHHFLFERLKNVQNGSLYHCKKTFCF